MNGYVNAIVTPACQIALVGDVEEVNTAHEYIELVANPDILASVTGPAVRVGFAAETDDLLANAADKLRRKALDLIVANDVTGEGAGFGSDTNRVVLLSRGGEPEELPLLSKREVADALLDRVAALLTRRGRSSLPP